jgi:glycosyltransferase involved in cell wall biosynthesis
MRIALLSWRDTTHPDGGGSEQYLESVARRLAAHGHEVTLVCAAHGAAPADEVVDGVRVRRRGGRLTVYLRGLLFLLSRTGRRQDVVVDVVNGVPFAAGLVRRRGVVVLVHHLHREQWRMIYPGLRGRVGWFVESRMTPLLYRRATYITVSNSTKVDLQRLGVSGRRVIVVRNGVDVPVSPSARSATPRLCVLARLVPHKRIEDALQVVAVLRNHIASLHLDVIGDGWWNEKLLGRCRELGVSAEVTFHGHVTSAVRDELLGQAWVLLVPSVKEGWAIAVMEAAALGTPTVAYRGGGGVTESVIDGETGLLADDLDDFVALSATVLQDGALRQRLSDAAALRARTFSWDDTATKFAEVLLTAQRLSGRRTG